MNVLDAGVEVCPANRWLKVLVNVYDERSLPLGNCFSVHLTDSREVWARGHTFFAEWLPVEVARDAVERFVPGWTLIIEESGMGAYLSRSQNIAHMGG
jgi:hypothetical protein